MAHEWLPSLLTELYEHHSSEDLNRLSSQLLHSERSRSERPFQSRLILGLQTQGQMQRQRVRVGIPRVVC
ncbi:putative glucosyl(mannosyl)glycerate-glucosidase [Synechococcus sp. PROS-9-1]|nr:putative glucosyl(mannosyl)glycerate-glucosidase [Synechococcus sp. PROS-9-1]